MAQRVRCFRTGKQAFPTRFECDLDRARLEKNAKGHRKMSHRDVPVRSYKCEFCGHWHHTSQAKDDENESRIVEW